MSYRLPKTKTILPNSLDDLKFPVNRIADNNTFNEKVKLIDENFNKLLEYCDIVDNKLPNEYSEFYSFDDGESYPSSSSETPLDHNYNHIEVIDTYIGGQLVICAKNNKIDFYTVTVETSSNLSAPIEYETIKDRGSLSFKNISYIKYNSERLYVYDSVYKSIFVYSLLSFLTNDVAISNIKFLRQFYKVNVNAFDFDGNNIYGIISNKLIIYNRDFNIINEYTLIDTNPIDIVIYDRIYLLYDNKIVILDRSINKVSEIPLIQLREDVFKSINTSKVDDGVLYVLSDKFIYKYTISGVFIGYYNVTTTTLNDFSILEKENFEYVFGLDENKLHIYKDKIISYKLYDEVNLRDKITLTNLQINNLELEQDFVYNSILQKLIFNVFLLYNSLLFKPFIQTDSNGVLVFNYLENLVNTDVIERKNIFYGQNEVFSYQTFNRSFENIYMIQMKIVELIQFGAVENTTNTLII